MEIYVIFDGPPSHESGRFVEVENERGFSLGRSQCGADWKQRPDGLWQLGPFASATEGLTSRERTALYLVARERSVDRTGAAWEESALRNVTEDDWTVIKRKLAD